MMFDWSILILMGILADANQAFTNKEQSDKLMIECVSRLRDEYKTCSYYLSRVKYLIKSIFIYLVLCFMLYLQNNVQTNLINWTFFIVNVLNVAMMIAGDKSKESYNRS